MEKAEENKMIAKKAIEYAETISVSIAQKHIGKSCYIKGWQDAVKYVNEKLNIACVKKHCSIRDNYGCAGCSLANTVATSGF